MTEHKKFSEYAATRLEEDVVLHFKQPLPLPPETQGGQPRMCFADKGMLLRVYDDGYLIRAQEGERFYSAANLFFVEFPSKISLL